MGDTVSTLLFQPPPPTKLKENKIIWLKTPQGKRIPGFYISFGCFDGEYCSRSLTVKELQATDTSEGITILYSHANAEDLGSIYPWCKFLSKMLRVNLFAYDYTGYGMAYDQGKIRIRTRTKFSMFLHTVPMEGMKDFIDSIPTSCFKLSLSFFLITHCV